MGRDLYERSPAARAVLDGADATLDFPLTRLLFDGPAEELQLTVNAQPAIVTVSLAALAAFHEQWPLEVSFPAPDFVAGHSVGEYAALVACRAAETAVGLRLVRQRAVLMHRAGQERPGSMTVVLGLGREAVAAACAEARTRVPGSYVDVANHNAATQVTIAGDPDGLKVAASLCQAAGARRAVPLPVSAAFHSAAMQPAADGLTPYVAGAAIADAAVPLVANVDARPVTSAAGLRQELCQQVARPVLWSDSMAVMLEGGVRLFVELGAGSVLSGLVQRLDGGATAAAAGDMAGVQAAVAAMSGVRGSGGAQQADGGNHEQQRR